MIKDRAHCRACMRRLNIDKMYGIKMPIVYHEMYICEECFLTKSHEIEVLQLPVKFDKERIVSICNNVEKISTINFSPTPIDNGVGDSEIISPPKKLETETEMEKSFEKKLLSFSFFKKIFN